METQQQSRIAYRLKCEKHLYLPSAIGLGIIPANAGSLNSWQPRPWYTGSSPRMRGTHDALSRRLNGSGIIPADARSTTAGPWTPRDDKDHPRGCGEHDANTYKQNSSQGSSPRMRAALFFLHHQGIGPIIIPADAGNTCPFSDRFDGEQDHPPRMRGAHHPAHQGGIAWGIIPADAGSTEEGNIHSR